jgi:biopolymer transport protein ExbD
MRSSNRARPGNGSAELQMAPLIDAVFLLLTYFLFTISLATIEGLLPSELALGDSFDQEKLELDEPKREVVIRVVQTGARVQYFVDDWPASSYANVSDHIGKLSEDSVIVLDAGATVGYEHVIRVYNRCLQVGVEKVVFPLSSNTRSAPRS